MVLLEPISATPNHMTGSNKRACRADTDMISELPSNVTQYLLECLPLQDVVRMSLLSTHWRYHWLALTKLKFDSEFIDFVLKTEGSSADSLSNIISNILLRLKGPIHSFNLSIPSWYPEEADISPWIYYVSGKGVTEFILNDHRDKKLRLSSGIFFSENLTQLVLHNCTIGSLPRTFRGFMHLTYLLFHMPLQRSNTRDTQLIETLISNCPRLHSLSLKIFEVQSLIIHAPKLEHLDLMGVFSDICFKGSTKITTLTMNVVCHKRKEMRQFFSYLLNIEKLNINCLFWPKLTRNCVRKPDKLTNELGRLRFLTLGEVPLNCRYVIKTLVSLFLRTPQLQQLDISGRKCELCTCDNKLDICTSGSLQSLKNIKLTGIFGLEGEFVLLKYLLAFSPFLEVMEVKLNAAVRTADAKLNVAKKVMQYRRASTSAEVFFKT